MPPREVQALTPRTGCPVSPGAIGLSRGRRVPEKYFWHGFGCAERTGAALRRTPQSCFGNPRMWIPKTPAPCRAWLGATRERLTLIGNSPPYATHPGQRPGARPSPDRLTLPRGRRGPDRTKTRCLLRELRVSAVGKPVPSPPRVASATRVPAPAGPRQKRPFAPFASLRENRSSLSIDMNPFAHPVATPQRMTGHRTSHPAQRAGADRHRSPHARNPATPELALPCVASATRVPRSGPCQQVVFPAPLRLCAR
jgi:hypothetical protein